MKPLRIFPLLLITLATIIAPRMASAQKPIDSLHFSPDCGSTATWDFSFFNADPNFINNFIFVIQTPGYTFTAGPNFGTAKDFNPEDTSSTLDTLLDPATFPGAGLGTDAKDTGFVITLSGPGGAYPLPDSLFDRDVQIEWFSEVNNTVINHGTVTVHPTVFQGNCTFDTVTASAATVGCDPQFNFNVFNKNGLHAPITEMKFELQGISAGTIRPGNLQAPAGWKVDSVTNFDAYFSTSGGIPYKGSLNGFIVPLRAEPVATAFSFVWTAYSYGGLIDRDTVLNIPAKPQACSQDGNPDSVTILNNGLCNFTAEVKNYHNSTDTVSVVTNWTFTITTPGVTFESATNPSQAIPGTWQNSGVGVGTKTISFFERPMYLADPQYAQPGGTIWTPRFALDNPNDVPVNIVWSDSEVTEALSSGSTFDTCSSSTADTAWLLAGSNACCNTLVVENAHTKPNSSIHAMAMSASAGTFIANSCISSNGWTPSVPGTSARFTNLTGVPSNDLASNKLDTIHFCIDPAQPNTPWTLTWTTIDPANNNLYSNTITVPGCSPPLVCDTIHHSQSTAANTCWDTIIVFNQREGGATIDSVVVTPMGGWSIDQTLKNTFWPGIIDSKNDSVLYIGTIPIQPHTSQGFVVSYKAFVGTPSPFNVQVTTYSGGIACTNTHSMTCTANEQGGGVSPSGQPQTLDVSVVPNPMNQEAQIMLTTGVFDRVQMSLLDVLGRTSKTVMNGTISAGDHSYTLDVSQLPMGTYYLRIEASGATVTKKLVVEH